MARSYKKLRNGGQSSSKRKTRKARKVSSYKTSQKKVSKRKHIGGGKKKSKKINKRKRHNKRRKIKQSGGYEHGDIDTQGNKRYMPPPDSEVGYFLGYDVAYRFHPNIDEATADRIFIEIGKYKARLTSVNNVQKWINHEQEQEFIKLGHHYGQQGLPKYRDSAQEMYGRHKDKAEIKKITGDIQYFDNEIIRLKRDLNDFLNETDFDGIEQYWMNQKKKLDGAKKLLNNYK